MKSFKHIVITRFNLKNETWHVDKNNREVLDADWLRKRYRLFDDFCWSSMIKQKEKDFIWLVYFDSNTPEYYKKKNKAYAKAYPNFIALYKESFGHFVKDLKTDLESFLNADTTHIITSRLDNDDAFHEDTIKTIQDQFNYQEKAIVDLNTGYCLQIAPSYKLFETTLTLGPFISLIEHVDVDNGCFETVVSRAHKEWDDVPQIIDIKNSKLWLQVIHENNLANTLIGRSAPLQAKLEGFHIKNAWMMPMRLTLDYYKTRLKKRIKKLI